MESLNCDTANSIPVVSHCMQTTSDLTHPLVSLKLAGLDPLNRVFMKLFIRDVMSLGQCWFEEVDTPGFSFHCHVLGKVEIMGLIVRVDFREKKHSYVVDDGTGVVLCNLWKNPNQQPPPQVNGLPQSLAQKQLEVASSSKLQNEGFDLGDLVCVRGRVTVFAGQKEIDILDMFGLPNPNCELQRVLALPSLLSSCYKQPLALPKRISDSLTNSVSTTSADSLKFVISKHIDENKETLYTFSIGDVFSWPAVHSLKSKTTDDSILTRSMLGLALSTISATKGSIVKRCDFTDEFEVVKEGSGFTAVVFDIMKTSQAKEGDGMGSHVNHIHRLLRHSHQYADVSRIVLQKAIQCLENTSDVISVDLHRYIPLT